MILEIGFSGILGGLAGAYVTSRLTNYALTARMSACESSTNGLISTTSSTLGAMETNLGARIDALDERLTSSLARKAAALSNEAQAAAKQAEKDAEIQQQQIINGAMAKLAAGGSIDDIIKSVIAGNPELIKKFLGGLK